MVGPSEPEVGLAVARVAFFLSRYGETAGGRPRPPAEFGEVPLDAVYRGFYARLGGGADYARFKAALINARNAAATGAGIGGDWAGLPRAAQWADIVPYLATGLSGVG